MLGKLSVLASLAVAQCSDGETYTLYRNSIPDLEMARVHVATFDASDRDGYNRFNCNLAADLFQRQPGVKTHFWCERGPFRP